MKKLKKGERLYEIANLEGLKIQSSVVSLQNKNLYEKPFSISSETAFCI